MKWGHGVSEADTQWLVASKLLAVGINGWWMGELDMLGRSRRRCHTGLRVLNPEPVDATS